MSNICISVTNKCYALAWSYGEICVHSNCCGRYGKGLKMWQARLHYNQEELKEQKNFNNWIEGLKGLQKKNQKKNINYINREIKKCEERIKHFENPR